MLSWKTNWEETRRHFTGWWNHEDFVLTVGTHAFNAPREALAHVPQPGLVEAYEDAPARARRNHDWLAGQQFPGDSLPISNTDIGPGSLALALGAEPGFSRETVWFEPCWHDVEDPTTLPPLRFDPDSRWWKVSEATCRAAVELGRGKYLVGCPDLVENLDIVSSLRDPQTLMVDMNDHPEWVEEKVREVNQAYFTAYQRIYDIIKLPDGSSCFGAFNLWGPGKTAKVQCDAAAMFSPAMFRRFVVPALSEQCAWLDHAMFHLDGTQCLDKLDLVLAIEDLDAVEWTPQAGIEGGGDPRWHDIYRRILAAGKSVQAIGVTVPQLKPLLDAVGPKGMYVMMWPRTMAEAEQALAIAGAYR